MALRFRKRNVKKTMYYVWFLGADESRAVRGSCYVLPIIDDMVERERSTRNIRKVTLEVSHKGLKIVQNIFNDHSTATDVVEIIQATSQSKVIKHLIPHNALTYVYQESTIVAVIFVISTATSTILAKWPIYIHVYRCDCEDTAVLLKSQLQKLIDKPENQRQIAELESKVQQHQPTTTNVTRTDSIPSNKSNKTGNVFDSLAEELKLKLTGISQVPLLLPPRDYDTVHRQKGNFHNIESRRCSNTNIVGGNTNETKNLRRITSSIESSGIGSDHSGSPQSSESFFNTSDDDEWNADTSESLIYLLQPQQKVKKQPYYFDNTSIVTHPQRIQPKIIDHTKRKPLFFNNNEQETTNEYYDVITSPQDRFKDAKEKFERLAQQQQLFKRPPNYVNKLTETSSNAAYRKSFYYNDHYDNIVGDEAVIVDRQRNRQRQRYSYAEAPVSKYYYH